MMTSGKHARLSASAAERWMNCPGSVELAGDKPDTTSAAAAEGTFAHHIAASCLEPGKVTRQPQPQDWLGNKTIIDGHEVECDQEMIDAIEVYLDDDAADGELGDKTWTEMSLREALEKIDPDFGGTADRVRYKPAKRLLIVKDYKHGAGTFVDVDDNRQLKIYALGALLSLPKGMVPAEVRIDIVQPRYTGAEPIRRYSFPAVELLDFMADLQEAADATRRPNVPLIAGPWCSKTFCPNARTCPVLERAQHAIVAAKFEPMIAYNPDDLSKMLAMVPMVKERIKALEEFAYQAATRGEHIPGFKLVDKQARRQWTDEEGLKKWAAANAVDVYAEPKLLSPAQVEKAVGKAGKDAVNSFCAAVSSGTVLVADTDKRAPVSKISSVESFTAIGGTVDKAETETPPAFSIL